LYSHTKREKITLTPKRAVVAHTTVPITTPSAVHNPTLRDSALEACEMSRKFGPGLMSAA
jgi:hypothetical protein